MAQDNLIKKAKLVLKAYEANLTKDSDNDYYFVPKSQRLITMEDLAEAVATLSVRNEDTAELVRNYKAMNEQFMWYLASGCSVSTNVGNFRVSVSGTLSKSELTSAPDRSRLKLNIRFAPSKEMREILDSAELAVEIEKAVVGPQLHTVVSAQDFDNPEAVTRGESVPVAAGTACIITGKGIKIGGEGAEIGLTLTRKDGDEGTTYFFTTKQLYPNTKTKVGFVMPADAPDGSVWEVKICTQLSSNGSQLLKTPRTAVMEDYFVVGQTSTVEPEEPEDPETGGGGEGEQEEDPLA